MTNTEKRFADSIYLWSDLGAKYAILPGDPDRVKVIAEYLENPTFVASHREYTSYIGTLEGEKVLVISTGMGGPSAAICIEELHMIGVDTVIRMGTCGGMQLPLLAGEIIIPTGAIRQEGTSDEYIYGEFPATPNFDVNLALRNAAIKVGVNYHMGIVQSKDSLYGQHDPGRMPIGVDLKTKYDAWISAGTLGSEMECAAVFIVSQILGMRAGAVLHIIWNKEREEANLESFTERDISKAILTAVEGIRELIINDKNKNRGEQYGQGV